MANDATRNTAIYFSGSNKGPYAYRSLNARTFNMGNGAFGAEGVVFANLDYYSQAGENTILHIQNRVSVNDDIYIQASGGVTIESGDLAELYHSPDQLELGDVVMFNPDKASSVLLSHGDNQNNQVGVVSSSDFALLMTLNSEKTTRSDHFPISLAGKLMLKISLENGPIKTGFDLGQLL